MLLAAGFKPRAPCTWCSAPTRKSAASAALQVLRCCRNVVRLDFVIDEAC